MRRQSFIPGRSRVAIFQCCTVLAWCGLFAPLATPVHGQALIVNEYNCVGSGDYLAAGNYREGVPPVLTEVKEDTYFRTYIDSADDQIINGSNNGRIEGNGGNWIELVVREDHLNIQGWQLRWAETDNTVATGANGTNLWYGAGNIEQGIITFANASIWSDLRAGTILTISEKKAVYIDTDWDTEGDDRNFTDGLDAGDPEVDLMIDLATDLSYDPFGGDWWIHISTREEQDTGTLLVTTVTNVTGDSPGEFSVGPSDWQVSIFNAANTLVYGPIGEAITNFGSFPGGINDEEAGRLEANPSQANLNNNHYDDVTSTTFGQPNEWGATVQNFQLLRPQFLEADFNLDDSVNDADLQVWHTGFGTTGGALHTQGDANGDGAVDGSDFLIWQRQYGMSAASYAPTAVPEPASIALLLLGIGIGAYTFGPRLPGIRAIVPLRLGLPTEP